MAQGTTAIHWEASVHTNQENRIGIYDITTLDPNNIIQTVDQQYPFGYAHNIWVTEDNSHVVVTGETSVDNQLSLWEIVTMKDGTQKADFRSGLNLQGGALAHNAFIIGNKVYASHYTKGAVVAEIVPDWAGRMKLELLWSYDTFPDHNNGETAGNWGVYPFGDTGLLFATDVKYGLFVFKMTEKYKNR